MNIKKIQLLLLTQKDINFHKRNQITNIINKSRKCFNYVFTDAMYAAVLYLIGSREPDSSLVQVGTLFGITLMISIKFRKSAIKIPFFTS